MRPTAGTQIRAVLDTSILVAAFRSSRGASAAVVQMALEDRFLPMISTALFCEYEDVLKRPDQCRVHGLSMQAVDQFLSAFADIGDPVPLYFRWRPQLQDKADEMVLETAINGQARWLVTHNVRDFGDIPLRFGIQVVSPGIFLEELRK